MIEERMPWVDAKEVPRISSVHAIYDKIETSTSKDVKLELESRVCYASENENVYKSSSVERMTENPTHHSREIESQNI